ncbi:hypothetical protein EG68_02146 [Paragonimus skrjabini miyazakii]|uniref:Cytosolic endo-beta-N-acetylglucosaminidase TIM barrel domain-containing protein n=1 Tax=Paragonimus skrjabini miyazakii TaxID=59628 RepID=A0A8S9Z9L5_9TREM|nr:hypothetical protein EG68_02146 [Paragonimus skrjabini miyazakii]
MVASPRQAVRVYGTLIFESVEDEIYKSVFWKPDSGSFDYIEFANRLDLLRRTMCFEGWLLNFEVCFPEYTRPWDLARQNTTSGLNNKAAA